MAIPKFDGHSGKRSQKIKVISWQFKVQWESHRTSLMAYTEAHLLQQDDKESG